MTGSKVHLVGGLPIECCMWEDAVVLADVEGNEPPQCSDGVDRIEQTPVVFETLPKPLDHRITEVEIGLRDDPTQCAVLHESVDSIVEVLDAAVDDDVYGSLRQCRPSTRNLVGFEQQSGCGGRLKSCGDPDGQDASGEVIDDALNIGLGPVEQPEDGRVDVPDVVGAHGSNANLGAFWMDPASRSAPPALFDRLGPRRGRCEDPSDSLGENGQARCRHMLEVFGGRHLLHGSELRGRKPIGVPARAGCRMVEFARAVCAAP